MPIATLIGWQSTTTARAGGAALAINVASSSWNADVLSLVVDVTNLMSTSPSSSSPSFYVPPAAFVPLRQVGVKIEVDPGDGALAVVPMSCLGESITRRGTLDGFGAAEITFDCYGREQSPLRSALLRTMRAVRMTLLAGVPGYVGAAKAFDGFIREASFDGDWSSITAQDCSLQISTKPIFYNLDVGSLRTRQDILLEVCALHGVPVGSIDLPNQGGLVYKAITEGGEKTVPTWVADFLSPTGARTKWYDGKLHVKRFDTTTMLTDSRSTVWPVRTLYPGNVRSIKITPPATNAPNACRATSSIYGYIGQTGQRTVVTSVPTIGNYTPLAATAKQSTSGVVSSIAITPTPIVNGEIARVDTTTVYDGGTVVSQVISEYGFYARRACPNQQSAGGGVTYNSRFDVFQFADGSWRADEVERYVKVRETTIVRHFDDSGYLDINEVLLSSYWPTIVPNTAVDGFGSEATLAAFISETGDAWEDSGGLTGYDGVEHFAYSWSTSTEYAWGDDHGITTMTVTGKSAQPVDLSYVYSPRANNTYGFGPAQRRWYGGFNLVGQLTETLDVTTFAKLSEIAYSETHVRDERATRLNGFQQIHVVDPPRTIAGALPQPEVLGSLQVAQSASTLVTDAVRVALSGTQIVETIQNDYCETLGELRTVATEKLREHAPIVSLELDYLDPTIEEGAVILLDHAQFGGRVPLLVLASSWSWNGSTADSSHTIDCRWYPPELMTS